MDFVQIQITQLKTKYLHRDGNNVNDQKFKDVLFNKHNEKVVKKGF